MKSVTKYEVTTEEISKLFKAASLGEVSEIKEISDGWYNSVFSAISKQNKKYVVKIAPLKSVSVLTHEQNIMESEVEFYRLLNEKTKVRTPNILFSDFSKEVIPTNYFIMEYLEGERLDKAKLSSEQKKKAAEKWAWILSEFHKIVGDGYGYKQAGLKGTWKEALIHMTKILIDDAASFNKKCRVGEKLLTYIDKYSYALEDVPCSLVNFDLHAMNIYCQKNNEVEIDLVIFDLERCFWGDAIGDFILPEFMVRDFTKKNIVKDYNLYSTNKVTGSKGDQIRYYLLCAYLATIMYTERFSRFRSFKKYFSTVYLAGTMGYLMLSRNAFSSLKKLGDRK